MSRRDYDAPQLRELYALRIEVEGCLIATTDAFHLAAAGARHMTDDHVSHGPVFRCHYGRSNSGGTLKRRLSGVCNAKADQ
jgi:hypothetical protein